MFAIFQTGGKQYRVTKGDVIEVEKINAKDGTQIDFHRVLMTADGDKINVGEPILEKVTVTAKVVSQGRYDKIRVVKFLPKKRHKSIQGHKQPYTTLEITGITA